MALINCPECGHEVSDKASACPNCGRPMGIPLICPECGAPVSSNDQNCHNCGCPIHQETTGYIEGDNKEGYSKSKVWIWILIAVLVCSLGGVGFYAFTQMYQKDKSEDSKEKASPLSLVDGRYSYQGSWESSQHAAQSCKLEFEKKEGNLVNGVYTNLRYQSRIPLNGTIKGDTLHFVGDINGKQLIINLTTSSDGNSLLGEGIDYAHSGEKVKLNFAKTAVSKVDDDIDLAYEESRQRAAEEEKERQRRQREEEERASKEGPAWLQGAWRAELKDDYGNSMGYGYEVFNHGSSKSYIGSSYLFERRYTVSGKYVTYDKGYFVLDTDNHSLIGADGNRFTKVSDDVYYTPSSSTSGSTYAQSGSSSRSYRFSSADDVIGWLSDKTFYNGSRRLRIRPNGVWLNDYCATFGPTWKALVRAMTATGQRVSFFVNPIDGEITDEAGDVFRLR